MNFFNYHMLSILIFLPLAGALIVMCLPEKRRIEIRIISLAFSALALIIAIKLSISAKGSGYFEFEDALSWIPTLGISYRVGLDGVSLLMVLLTCILVPLAIACSWREIKRKVKAFHMLVLVLQTAMIGTFAAMDVFLFYVFWEAVLIPMYFIIGIWGSGNRIRSSIKFVIFTTLGSVIMLVAILYCQSKVGGFDLISWYGYKFAPHTQLWLFAAFAFAFAIKLPLVPFHTWLPDAHTDAPTGGSILLAGVLLKMGAYGFYRFAMPLFPIALSYFIPYLVILSVIAIIYGGLLALVQADVKRLIAYSSVAHMGFVMLGLAALDINAVQGAALQMFNHGITTGALFMMVGMLYGRTHTRMISDYGGSAKQMPLLATAFIVLAVASAGLPGLSTFVGEFMILLGSFQTQTYYSVVAVLGVIIAAAYMLWTVQRIFFGPERGVSTSNLKDLNIREHLMIAPVIAVILAVGVWPAPWLAKIDKSSQNFLKLAQHMAVSTADAPATPSMEIPKAVESVPPTEQYIEQHEEAVEVPPPPPSPAPRMPGRVELPELPPGVEDQGY